MNRIFIGILLIGFAFLSACATGQFGMSGSTECYIFEDWIDRDNNFKYQLSEFVGKGTKTFRVGENEEIWFLMSFKGYPVGTECEYRLLPPNFDAPTSHHRKFKINHKPYHLEYACFLVKSHLYDKYGSGEYRFQWFINEKLAGEKIVTVLD